MYRLMFGSTSAHGINAPAGNVLTLTLAEIEQHEPSFAHVVRGVHRAMLGGRITAHSADDDAAVVATAAQFWALIHGFVMLELAGFYGDDGSAVAAGAGRDDDESSCCSWRFTRAGASVTAGGDRHELGTPSMRMPPHGAGAFVQSSYLTVTVAPAASSLALASSAASLATFSSSGLGAPSTRSLASLRPRPETISRTTLMTPIFLSPAASRMTSNSDCSSAASAGAAAGPPRLRQPERPR